MDVISCCGDSRQFDMGNKQWVINNRYGTKQQVLKTDVFQCAIKYSYYALFDRIFVVMCSQFALIVEIDCN